MPALQEPLPTVLRSIASAMRMGIPHGTYGKGGGSYNWREVVAADRAHAVLFLREAVERGDQGRTLRRASRSLLPEGYRTADPIFLVVVCASGRAEGEVTNLVQGDLLYLVTAPNAPAEGMVARRLN